MSGYRPTGSYFRRLLLTPLHRFRPSRVGDSNPASDGSEIDARRRPLKRRVAVYAAVYTLAVLLSQWLLPAGDWRFAFHVWTVVIGYLVLLMLCVVGYLRNARPGNLAALAAESGRLDIRHDR